MIHNFSLNSSTNSQKFIFHRIPRLSRKLIASKKDCKRRGWRGGFLSEKKIGFLRLLRWEFSQKSIGQVDNHYYNFFLRNFEAVSLSWINVVQDNFSQVY